MLEPLVKAQTKSVRSEILASSFLVESMDSYRSSFHTPAELILLDRRVPEETKYLAGNALRLIQIRLAKVEFAKTLALPSSTNPEPKIGSRNAVNLFVRERRNVDGTQGCRFDRVMKTKTTGLILALCCFGVVLCFAEDPQIGTSKLNESKSKLTSGTEKIKPTYI